MSREATTKKLPSLLDQQPSEGLGAKSPLSNQFGPSPQSLQASELRLVAGGGDREEATTEHHSHTSPAVLQAKEMKAVADPENTKQVAKEGLTGTPQKLPHLDKVQGAFEGHDLSNVKAYVGGPAAKAAKEMGASAYATGDKVAFKEQPDVKTVAHEAAHVVQQREGVSLKGGVGEKGDKYEKAADAVAEKVGGVRPKRTGFVDVSNQETDVQCMQQVQMENEQPSTESEEAGVKVKNQTGDIAETSLNSGNSKLRGAVDSGRILENKIADMMSIEGLMAEWQKQFDKAAEDFWEATKEKKPSDTEQFLMCLSLVASLAGGILAIREIAKEGHNVIKLWKEGQKTGWDIVESAGKVIKVGGGDVPGAVKSSIQSTPRGQKPPYQAVKAVDQSLADGINTLHTALQLVQENEIQETFSAMRSQMDGAYTDYQNACTNLIDIQADGDLVTKDRIELISKYDDTFKTLSTNAANTLKSQAELFDAILYGAGAELRADGEDGPTQARGVFDVIRSWGNDDSKKRWLSSLWLFHEQKTKTIEFKRLGWVLTDNEWPSKKKNLSRKGTQYLAAGYVYGSYPERSVLRISKNSAAVEMHKKVPGLSWQKEGEDCWNLEISHEAGWAIRSLAKQAPYSMMSIIAGACEVKFVDVHNKPVGEPIVHERMGSFYEYWYNTPQYCALQQSLLNNVGYVFHMSLSEFGKATYGSYCERPLYYGKKNARKNYAIWEESGYEPIGKYGDVGYIHGAEDIQI